MEARLAGLSPEHRTRILSKSSEVVITYPKPTKGESVVRNGDLPDHSFKTRITCTMESFNAEAAALGENMPRGTTTHRKTGPLPIPKEKEPIEPKRISNLVVEYDGDLPMARSESSLSEEEDSFVDDDEPKARPKRTQKTTKFFADEQSSVEEDDGDGKPKAKGKRQNKKEKATFARSFSNEDRKIFDSPTIFDPNFFQRKPFAILRKKDKKNNAASEKLPECYTSCGISAAYSVFTSPEFRAWRTLQKLAGATQLNARIMETYNTDIVKTWRDQVHAQCTAYVEADIKLSVEDPESDGSDCVEKEPSLPVYTLGLKYRFLKFHEAKKDTEMLVQLLGPLDPTYPDDFVVKVDLSNFHKLRALWLCVHPFELMQEMASVCFKRELEKQSEKTLVARWMAEEVGLLNKLSQESFKTWWAYQMYFKCTVLTDFVMSTSMLREKSKFRSDRMIVQASK